jgi:hypothetical protein
MEQSSATEQRHKTTEWSDVKILYRAYRVYATEWIALSSKKLHTKK